jgi:hypothetical protein
MRHTLIPSPATHGTWAYSAGSGPATCLRATRAARTLNLDLFAVDARRVRAHLRDAETALTAGDIVGATDHDRAALRLAQEELLDGDVPPALAGLAAELEIALQRASERTTEEEEKELVAAG